uniref:death domain-containing protein 1 n=1 Tax=Centroberyx gerrardi TaxID=166262 RepID=UPI003AACD8C8
MDEAGPHHGRSREDSLLNMLVETIRGLEAVRRSRTRQNGRRTGEEPSRGEGGQVEIGGEGGMVSPPGSERESEGMGGGRRSSEGERREKECEQKVLGVLRELSAVHSDRVSAWREAVRASACMLTSSPPGGSDQLHPPITDNTEPKVRPCSDSFSSTFLSVAEDIESIMDRLNTIITKLDTEIITSCAEEASAVDADTAALCTKQQDSAALQETRDSQTSSSDSVTPEDTGCHSNPHDPLGSGSGRKQGADDGADQSHTKPPHSHTLSLGIESFGSSDCSDGADTRQGLEVRGQVTDNHCVSEEIEKDREREETKKKEEMNTEWVTVGLSGQLEDSQSDVPHACYITAPVGVAKAMRCEVADTLSSLMVTGSEELVSRVIRVKVQDGTDFHFPVTVAVPFRARYRGNYRDVVVKVVNGEKRASYITPITTEGSYGGQRGSFAEVRVYSLGLFAVVSCVRRESYTVPRKGLSLKLPMDPRICLDYLPGSFTAPVMAQSMIQPVDAVLLATVKSGSDVFYSVISTSPLLYLTHPSSQPLRRPLTLTLPCPPNPEKKRAGQGEERPQTWLLVVRLLSPVQPCHLTSLAEELEESVCRHTVAIVLQRRREEPHGVLVAALPSRDLGWELSKLRAQGYSGLPDASAETSVCEGDQLLLRFSGNITSAGTQNNQNGVTCERIAFHSQRKNHLFLHLTEVDSFGNYSSPHYKGTAMFYKVARGQLERRGDSAVPLNMKLLGDPVCKLSLTLPKKVRTINRAVSAKVKLCEETESLSDSLLLWLSGELSEEETALLVLSLRLRRSAAQLVKLRAGDSPSARAFHLLALWRRGLPAAPHPARAAQLARCLAKSGRPDLARELLLRQAAATRDGSLK